MVKIAQNSDAKLLMQHIVDEVLAVGHGGWRRFAGHSRPRIRNGGGTGDRHANGRRSVNRLRRI